MKQLMKHLSCLLMVMLACVALPSCGDDDDEPDDSGEKTVKELIVGTWRYTYYDYGYNVTEADEYTFKSNGKGIGKEDCLSNEPDVWEFNWTYNDKTNILTMIYVDVDSYYGDTEIEEWYISDIDDQNAIVYWVEDGQIDKSDLTYLTKVK